MTQTVSVELPAELVELVGSREDATAKAREALVLELLREARISQGRAAQMLDITRWDLLPLMALHGIQSGPETAEEMRQEIENVRRIVGKS